MNDLKLTDHIVVFIDVLGLREAFAASGEEAERLLQTYASGVTSALAALSECVDSASVLGEWKYKVFTDNFILATEVHTDDLEQEVGDASIQIAHFQAALVRNGWFCRGGLTVGPLYFNEHVLFGRGLVDAYELERDSARDPRVVVDGNLVSSIARHLTSYGDPYHSPQNGYFAIDVDEQLFVNYLFCHRGDDAEAREYSLLRPHKNEIRANLKRWASSPRIWSKYRWLAEYHNFYCSKWRPKDKSIRIGRKDLRSSPQLLVPEAVDRASDLPF